jgi:predicted DCC family thiol-disulfide oxidoreductase YuxK
MPVEPKDSRPENILVYDELCFFCSNYVRLLNLRTSIDGIMLVSARDAKAVEGLGLRATDLNEGMVLILEGKRYCGEEAVHHLALLSTSSTVFNKINRLVFRSPRAAVALYPFLKLGRRIYLVMSGKSEIR